MAFIYSFFVLTTWIMSHWCWLTTLLPWAFLLPNGYASLQLILNYLLFFHYTYKALSLLACSQHLFWELLGCPYCSIISFLCFMALGQVLVIFSFPLTVFVELQLFHPGNIKFTNIFITLAWLFDWLNHWPFQYHSLRVAIQYLRNFRWSIVIPFCFSNINPTVSLILYTHSVVFHSRIGFTQHKIILLFSQIRTWWLHSWCFFSSCI